MTAGPFFDINVRHALGESFTMDVALQSDSEAIALFGPSGCGKSTLLHIIAGVLRVRGATVRVAGRTLQDATMFCAPAQRRVGLVVQDALLFPLLDVRDNLRFGRARATGRIALDDVVRILEIEHLLDRRVRNLSGGERQRVALGRALLSEPDTLLLDEPFAPLDAPRRDRLVGMLDTIRGSWRLPMILVSHDPVDIASLVDEVFRMDSGSVKGRESVARGNVSSPSETG